MTFLPLVERELRIRPRLKRTYFYRTAGACFAIVILSFALITALLVSNPGTIGKGIFTVLSWMAFIYCLLEGTRTTADCLSEEKRAGTLGLLFLTDLKGYDVVLGKLLGTSLNTFYGLLAVLPPLAIPLLLGGVTAGEFWRLVLVLLSALLFSLSAGLFVSAISFQERRAWLGTVALVGTFAIVLPIIAELDLPYGALCHWNPTSAFLAVEEQTFLAKPNIYFAGTIGLLAIALLLLVSAAFLLPRCWQARIETASGGIRLFGISLRMFTTPERLRRKRLDQLSGNPVIWLASRDLGQRAAVWLVICLICLAAGVFWRIASGSGLNGTFSVAGLLVNYAMVVWVAAKACQCFPESRSSGALELLLVSPVTVKNIVDGHLSALERHFLVPFVLLFCAEFFFAILQAASPHQADPIAFLMMGYGIFLFAFEIYAAAYLGLWMGLRSRKQTQALTKTLVYLLIVPLLLFPCWPFVMIIKNIIIINFAKEQIRLHFRFYVTERFAPGSELGSWTPSPARPVPPILPNVPPA
ncbi:MAG TPA: hypothetical protein VGE41_01075 [Verrucomicrobiae bacterium]